MNPKKILITTSTVIVLYLIIRVSVLSVSGWQFQNPSYDKYPIRGIDVSHHQGAIDWDMISSKDIKFVYLKATEGRTHKDRRFHENLRGAKDQGLKVGAYLYFNFNPQTGGKVHAKEFIKFVPKHAVDLPPAIDVEYSGNADLMSTEWLLKNLQVCLDLLENHYGQKPIIYVNKWFYYRHLRGHFDDYKFWIRDTVFPAGFLFGSDWAIWQYYDKGQIKGIKGPVDLNVFNGTLDDFDRF